MSDIEKFYNAIADKLQGKKWNELTRNQQDAIIQAVNIILAVNAGYIN